MRLATPSWRSVLGLAAKVAVSGLAVALLCGRVDLAGVRASLAAASPADLGLALAAFLLIPVLGGLRWWAVLRGLGLRSRVGEVTTIFSVASVVSQFLPSVAGDGFRVWLTTRRGNLFGVALQSVFLERVVMLLALLTLALATAPLLAARTGQAGAVWMFAALLAGGVAGLSVLMAADCLPAGVLRLRPMQSLAGAAAQTRALVLSRWGLRVAVASIVANLNFVLAAVLLGRALDLAATPLDFLAIMPAVTLATTLPLSLGGWGVREGVLVLLLGHIGVPAGEALALSMLYGLGGVLCGLPGLLVWAFEARRIVPAAGALRLSEAGR